MSQRLVLIADDDKDVRHISKTILESRGFAVVQAANGLEAVDVARRHRPNLVFLDLMMPEMDGWETAAMLKDDPETRAIPLVAVTASEPPAEEVKRVGFCALITKPVSPPDLVQAVAVCLDAHEQGDHWIPNLIERLRGRGMSGELER